MNAADQQRADDTLAVALPAVSTIVLCHNYARFLPEALASVDAQTLRPVELIVCDDGSTDNTWEVMQDYAAGRTDVRLVRNVRALGVVAAFNSTVALTTSPVVHPLSADDWVDPTFIEQSVRALVDNNWSFAYTGYERFGAETGKTPARAHDLAALLAGNYIHGGTVFTRELFEATGGYSEELHHLGGEDWDFWLNAVGLGFTGGPVMGPVLHWRRHENGSRDTRDRAAVIRLRKALFTRHWRLFASGAGLRAGWRVLNRQAWTSAPETT